MNTRLRVVLSVVALVVLAGVGTAPAASAFEAGLSPRVVTQAPIDQPPGGTAEEAPSSIRTGDQVRAFLVLAVCVLVIAVPVTLTVLRAQRRQREASPPDPGRP